MERKVVIFITGLAGGGAERVMLNLAAEFADQSINVDLVVTRARGELIQCIPENVNLVDLKASRIATSLPALVRYFRKERPAFVLSALSPANCLAVLARMISRVPFRLILSEHNTLSKSLRVKPGLKIKFMPWLMSWTYPKSDGIVAVSNGVADDISRVIGLDRSRIDVIYNPIFSENMLRKSKEKAEHVFFDSGLPVIIGVGRLIPQKDFSTLIYAFSEVCKIFPAKLIILGEGPLRETLESLVNSLGLEGHVDFPGFVGNPYSYMRQADVFVLSSRWEGFGNVVVEALACETSVVSTDCPNGPSEILEKGRWGKLVGVGDVKEMAEMIIKSVQTPNPGFERRAQDFSVHKISQKYISIIFN